MRFIFTVVYFSLVVNVCYTDLNLANLRGSNNRLNEQSATRANNNRLFDTQNNNRGGYNVGDRGSEAATDESGQYQMKYFQSSASVSAKTHLKLEWTVQHGFGTNDKLNSNFVIQMMCQPVKDFDENNKDRLRDGMSTDDQLFERRENDAEDYSTYLERKQGAEGVNINLGLHENFYWYDKCRERNRNSGLFDADQIGDQNGRKNARHTRQNPNGGRSGYECPEERDYYPYWAPNPWKDIAVLTSNFSDCSRYQSQSFNVEPRGECVEIYPSDTGATVGKTISHNNEADCLSNTNYQWVVLNNYLEINETIDNEEDCDKLGSDYKWGKTMNNYIDDVCFVKLLEPECLEGDFSRVNHNGNVKDTLNMMNYNWHIPHFPSGNQQRCVLRVRYNISTNDYDPMTTTKDNVPTYFPYTDDNPPINVGQDEDGNDITVQVNVDLEQFGRTFQDRSHVFILEKRPDELNDIKIHNLNVRGKRGNIVQVYPAVEYDFMPNTMEIHNGDAVHVQWTGSNTHHNNNPSGDGQAGNDGQGKEGSDRHNMVCIDRLSVNYPSISTVAGCMFNKIESILWHFSGATSNIDMAISAATSGYANSNEDLDDLDEMSSTLDNAPASYPGAVVKFHPGTYYYMCTRNNAFTNRSQKGTLVVKQD